MLPGCRVQGASAGGEISASGLGELGRSMARLNRQVTPWQRARTVMCLARRRWGLERGAKRVGKSPPWHRGWEGCEHVPPLPPLLVFNWSPQPRAKWSPQLLQNRQLLHHSCESLPPSQDPRRPRRAWTRPRASQILSIPSICGNRHPPPVSRRAPLKPPQPARARPREALNPSRRTPGPRRPRRPESALAPPRPIVASSRG